MATTTPAVAADRFITQLAALTGLDPKVIAAWVRAEGAYAPNGTGGFNFLNVRGRSTGRGYSGVRITRSSGGFAKFGSVDQAVKETAFWINRMPNYAGIRASTQQGPASQLAAIARSPWDANHYAGGRGLERNYRAVAGDDGKSLGDRALGVLGDAVGSGVSGAVTAVIPGGPVLDAINFPDISPGDILNPGALVGDVAGWVTRLALGLIVLGLAGALFYNGIRRLSGDRIPSTRELAELAATRGASRAA